MGTSFLQAPNERLANFFQKYSIRVLYQFLCRQVFFLFYSLLELHLRIERADV